MKANTISSRRAGLSSPSSACLSATLIDRFEATASARIDGSSISPSWIAVSGRQPLVELGVILELIDDRAHQRLGLRAVGRLLLDLFDLGRMIAVASARGSTRRARCAPSTSTRTVPSGSFSSCIAVAIDAEVVERIAIGIVLARIELGDQEQFLVGGHRRFERSDRFFAADEQGHDPVRENDDVAERQDRKGTGCHASYMGGRAAGAQRRSSRTPTSRPGPGSAARGRAGTPTPAQNPALAPDDVKRREDQERPPDHQAPGRRTQANAPMPQPIALSTIAAAAANRRSSNQQHSAMISVSRNGAKMTSRNKAVEPAAPGTPAVGQLGQNAG